MTSGHQLNSFNYEDYIPSDGILCPICEINCNTLENLNKHLDVAHSEEDSKGALLSWLRNAQKKVQTSLSTNNSTLKIGSPTQSNSLKQWVDPSLLNKAIISHPNFFVSDMDKQGEYVTREHWQRETGHDKCNIVGCNKIVGKSGVGKQYCRRCGKLYCDLHTQYEIKLSQQGHHDPEHGVWCKVCLNCFTNRKDYNTYEGVTRNRTDYFMKLREKTIDRVQLESNRLEKRLEKLARVHHSMDNLDHSGFLSPSSNSLNSFSLDRSSTSSRDSLASMLSPKSSFVSNSNSILSMKLKYRDGEQSIIKWEDDRSVKACPYCGNSFTLINRKHHCRLCGKVVCGNIKCSKMIPLFTDMSSDTFDDEPVGDTRACRDCQRYVFRRKLRNEEASKPLPIIQLYNQLSITRNNIEKQLPKFHQSILMLEKENITNHTHESFVKAAQIRKLLLENFTLYDTLAKSIKSLPANTPCMKRLQANICHAANLYLQQNMLPLQMLPRILKTTNKKKDHQKVLLEEQLETYLEQYHLVEGYIKEANADRKYDDVKTLKSSLEELQVEISRLRTILG
ncbi:FYVE zinc finger-domain-containing protein [Cokeromyces recurvatus]|uniref:FYVE zinc finger-domain-containing protein n=1 Tax=Cokeromyces recurvatus TaxID=90255 RepID=UPI0022201260|nr:FYVE zinc finger-domain-containing protein [Cokeromyces recurvatus]KAI7901701.1 FYVE zinc finger-domain-containing protein [Cokeromyces recurvatus]